MFHEDFLESCVFFLFTSFKSTGVKAEEQKQTVREHACMHFKNHISDASLGKGSENIKLHSVFIYHWQDKGWDTAVQTDRYFNK